MFCLQKIKILASGTLSQAMDLKILSRQVDRVNDKIHRRSRLLTTITTVARRGWTHPHIGYTLSSTVML